MKPEIAGLAVTILVLAQPAWGQLPLTSPDGRLALEFRLDAAGTPRYLVRHDGSVILQPSRLGLVRDDADFSRGLALVATSETQAVQLTAADPRVVAADRGGEVRLEPDQSVV